MDICRHCLITKASWTDDPTKHSYRLAFCLIDECDYPARMCLVKFQQEVKENKVYSEVKSPHLPDGTW